MSDGLPPAWVLDAQMAFLENFWYLIVFWAGAIVGSFLGVVIYRLPLGKSINRPPSYCPHCDHTLSWWENVPILGFLGLRGRCFSCKKPIPWRDFAMEILTACMWTALFARLNDGTAVSWANFILSALFASMLIAAVFIDLDHFIVPDEFNWVGITFGVGRDLLCIVFIVMGLGDVRFSRYAIPDHTLKEFLYFGWLPRAIVGGLLYGAILFAVSFFAFTYYARGERESFAGVARRFFTFEDLPEELMTDAEKQALADMKAEEEAQATDCAEPIRLRFAPGFITILAAAFLAYVIGAWALLLPVVIFLAFFLITRTSTEGVGDVFHRFFKAADLPYQFEEEEPASVEASATPAEKPNLPEGWTYFEDEPKAASDAPHAMSVEEAQREADLFAKEAETGKHGGMGLGDVKLALAIGALLGPLMAVMSLLAATFFGAITGVALKAIHRRSDLRFGVPFVPFMAAGALLVMLYGQAFVTWYSTFLSPPTKVQTQTVPPPPGMRVRQP